MANQPQKPVPGFDTLLSNPAAIAIAATLELPLTLQLRIGPAL
jgi:hypothetical protein